MAANPQTPIPARSLITSGEMRKAWRSQRVLSPQAVRLPDGANVITLTVTDDSFDPQTNSSTDTVTITVGAAAQPPRANAGPDQTVPDTDSAAGENVTLSGAESSDPDGSIVSYVWRNAAGATIATTANAQVRLPDGVNTLTLTVTDNARSAPATLSYHGQSARESAASRERRAGSDGADTDRRPAKT